MKKIVIIIILVILGLNYFSLGQTYYATDKQKLVALTFDDGPTERYTPEVLNILQEYDIPATFFLVGRQVEKHPNLARQIVDMGHEVENHTYTHAHLEVLTYGEVLEEIEEADKVFDEILGINETKFFRPPRKKINLQVVYAQLQQEKVMALWDVGIENRSVSNPKEMRERVLKYAPDGGVILLHDGSPGSNRDNTIKALPLLIEAYSSKGYRFVTLKEYYDQVPDRKIFKH